MCLADTKSTLVFQTKPPRPTKIDLLDIQEQIRVLFYIPEPRYPHLPVTTLQPKNQPIGPIPTKLPLHATMPLLITPSLSSPLALTALSHSHKLRFCPSLLQSRVRAPIRRPMSWLGKFGLGFGGRPAAASDPASAAIAQGPDDDVPAPGQQFAQFGAGCFWGVELAFQRVPGVSRTEVGYTQGVIHNPTYEDVCSGATGHSEVVRLEYDPAACRYEDLLDVFWARHDPTTLNRQGGDVGTQYRSGIYYYTPEQEKAAKESLEKHQQVLNRKIVTEILPAKKFYRAEEYHQQYLAKGGRFGLGQSAAKGCNDPIRCYG